MSLALLDLPAEPMHVATAPPARDRIGSDAARAVGRFRPEGPLGYRASTMPGAPLRATRGEAAEDERAWRERSS